MIQRKAKSVYVSFFEDKGLVHEEVNIIETDSEGGKISWLVQG